jgi:small subunit ribosomal protein S20
MISYDKMPQTKSAKKSLRNSRRKQLRNLPLKTGLRKVLNETKKKHSKESFKKAQSLIDRLARKGIIHKNKAARLKSRFSK